MDAMDDEGVRGRVHGITSREAECKGKDEGKWGDSGDGMGYGGRGRASSVLMAGPVLRFSRVPTWRKAAVSGAEETDQTSRLAEVAGAALAHAGLEKSSI